MCFFLQKKLNNPCLNRCCINFFGFNFVQNYITLKTGEAKYFCLQFSKGTIGPPDPASGSRFACNSKLQFFTTAKKIYLEF